MNVNPHDKMFWEIVRRALLMVCRAIEKRYEITSKETYPADLER